MASSTSRTDVHRDVRLVPVRAADVCWLMAIGLDPELIGVQYHRAETPLQLVISPLRAITAPFVTARLVWVDGRRAGYIGRSPLSGNYEYLLRPWARGGGIGRRVIVDFLAHHRAGDRSRAFFVSAKNPRSMAALRRSLDQLGWVEGTDFDVLPVRFGQRVQVRAG